MIGKFQVHGTAHVAAPQEEARRTEGPFGDFLKKAVSAPVQSVTGIYYKAKTTREVLVQSRVALEAFHAFLWLNAEFAHHRNTAGRAENSATLNVMLSLDALMNRSVVQKVLPSLNDGRVTKAYRSIKPEMSEAEVGRVREVLVGVFNTAHSALFDSNGVARKKSYTKEEMTLNMAEFEGNKTQKLMRHIEEWRRDILASLILLEKAHAAFARRFEDQQFTLYFAKATRMRLSHPTHVLLNLREGNLSRGTGTFAVASETSLQRRLAVLENLEAHLRTLSALRMGDRIPTDAMQQIKNELASMSWTK